MTEQDAPRSPGSTVETSEMDEHMTTHASSPVRADPRTSLQHVLGDADSQRGTPSAARQHEMTEDEDVRTPAAQGGAPKTTASSRKKKAADGAAGAAANSSIYSGNKIRHLKKDDGEPLWRKDIQYEFLKAIFENKQEVFTNSYEPPDSPPQTFSQLYIDAMARSSKTSKILRDKLLSEHEPAKNMAMVCLLVNLGRMNTTLNFFPEMRAQLRTYHAIPSLQAHQDPNSYKQLQDAPRLKSILKGASEDRTEPNTLDKIKDAEIPRTNPVNLIFVLAQYAPRITELHFPPSHDFYDLIMRTGLSSASRATAFLWLMWFYLESDFTEEGAEENPFGSGVDYQTHVRNQGVPKFVNLSAEEEAEENIDTEEEVAYGQSKMRERKRIIEADQAAFQAEQGPPKRGPKPKLYLPPDDGGPSPAAYVNRIRPKHEDYGASPAGLIRMRPKYESDIDSTRSTPPPRGLTSAGMRMHGVLNKGRGSKHQLMESSPIAPGDPPSIVRRSRPLTAHQLAVERNRNQRVDYILSRGVRKEHHRSRKIRRQEGSFYRALQRLRHLPDPYDDSEGEENLMKDPEKFRSRGFGSLVQLNDEEDDFGEEMSAYAAAFRRIGRRLDRWDSQKDLHLGVMSTTRPAQQKSVSPGAQGANQEDDESEDDRQPGGGGEKKKQTKKKQQQRRGGKKAAPSATAEADPDDAEKETGMNSENDEESAEGEEDLDDVEKALLGIRGDETDDDASDGAMDVD